MLIDLHFYYLQSVYSYGEERTIITESTFALFSHHNGGSSIWLYGVKFFLVFAEEKKLYVKRFFEILVEVTRIKKKTKNKA